jgi:metallophosphoesterase superfamily enzyme
MRVLCLGDCVHNLQEDGCDCKGIDKLIDSMARRGDIFVMGGDADRLCPFYKNKDGKKINTYSHEGQ